MISSNGKHTCSECKGVIEDKDLVYCPECFLKMVKRLEKAEAKLRTVRLELKARYEYNSANIGPSCSENDLIEEFIFMFFELKICTNCKQIGYEVEFYDETDDEGPNTGYRRVCCNLSVKENDEPI